ncbi:MAG: DUF1592 domain-containing protein [Verrucomicrobiales bacterium]|nr:DUF1592 domain-containing protein [Verrucomicrobiales bacterium]
MNCLFATACFLFASIIFSAEEKFDYARDVRPVLEQHCFKCHGPEKQKSDVRFDTLSTDFLKDRPAAETWHDALNALQLGEMPPDDEPELSAKDRAALTGWIEHQIATRRAAQKSTGGEVILRRLNRVEYENTMSDLLGIRADYAVNLPPDTPSEDGFKNNGAALSMSPMQLEYYLQAARDGLSRAIVTGPAPEKLKVTATESATDKGKGNYTNRLGQGAKFILKLEDFPYEGDFIVRIKARAELVDGADFPRMKATFGFRADTQTPFAELGEVDVKSAEPEVFEFRGRMEQLPLQSRTQSKYPGQLVWITNEWDDGKKRPISRQVETIEEKKNPKNGKITKKKVKKTEYIDYPDVPKIVIESVEYEGLVFESWPPRHHAQILIPSEKRETGELVYAEEVVANFMRRAYRRPVEDAEVKSMLRLYSRIRPTVDSFEEAIRETLALVLVSPDFLYLVEPEPGGKKGTETPLTDFEFASRLSYFLWSTMPDERLFDLASTGELRKPKVLAAEVDRMLEDERSQQFVEQFSHQWLDLGSVGRVAVNPEYYEGWDNAIKPHMQAETREFFEEILQNELSALNFLDSDFAMLNAPLARHYGIENGPRGMEFERVDLPADSIRGGLLTQASVLLGHSTGEDSHPILRAVWIRERLLDDPPAPPPPNAPELDSENPDFAKLSVRQQLEAHREEAACNDCHRGIDPWGIALENFDAIGNWRVEVRRKNGRKFVKLPAETETELPDGTVISGVDELKQYLLEKRKDQFAKAFVSRLTGYALGRTIEFEDEEAIETLTDDFKQQDYRIQSLIQAITSHKIFQSK